MTRPPTSDRLKPMTGEPKSKPKLPVLTTTGEFMACSCGGWATSHKRTKVREDRAQRHLDRKHGGRGIWM